LHQRDQRGVLEHVGVVAGMEGVAITKHGPMLTAATALALRWRAAARRTVVFCSLHHLHDACWRRADRLS
ncbi:MAG: hypothetical protein V4711_11505, partial [Pseudomonadota bacterium]